MPTSRLKVQMFKGVKVMCNKILFFTKLAFLFSFLNLSCEKNSTEISGNVPDVTTNDITSVTSFSAQCGGTVISDGGSPVISRGVCWGNINPPAINDSTTNEGTDLGSFNSTISGLRSRKTYAVRAYATNSVGTGYGNTLIFKTDSLMDIDGNIFDNVTIGNQRWMMQNLQVTHYRNGDPIPNVTDSLSWSNWKSGAYCNYGNVESFVPKYGRLYNWYAVNDNRGIAPSGWHVPSKEEWETLIEFLGGEELAGEKMKIFDEEAPNWNGTNNWWFSALPSGNRNMWGQFHELYINTEFWSATEDSILAYTVYLHDQSSDAFIGSMPKSWGFSIRCVAD